MVQRYCTDCQKWAPDGHRCGKPPVKQRATATPKQPWTREEKASAILACIFIGGFGLGILVKIYGVVFEGEPWFESSRAKTEKYVPPGISPSEWNAYYNAAREQGQTESEARKTADLFDAARRAQQQRNHDRSH